jgi:hypothetical protein
VSTTEKANRDGPSGQTKGTLEKQATAAVEAVKSVAGDVKEEAAGMLDDAKATAEDAFSRQKDLAADQISGFAKVLRSAAHQLHEQQDGAMAGYATQAASALDRTSRALDEKDLSGLMHDVEDLGRRQPLLLFGGAVLTGFLLARFLKSSAPAAPQDEASAGSGNGLPGPAAAGRGAAERGRPPRAYGNGGA